MYYKRKNKGLMGLIVILLVLLLAVGGLGFLSKGYVDWNYKDWFSFINKDKEEEADTSEAFLSTMALNADAGTGYWWTSPIYDYGSGTVQDTIINFYTHVSLGLDTSSGIKTNTVKFLAEVLIGDRYGEPIGNATLDYIKLLMRFPNGDLVDKTVVAVSSSFNGSFYEQSQIVLSDYFILNQYGLHEFYMVGVYALDGYSLNEDLFRVTNIVTFELGNLVPLPEPPVKEHYNFLYWCLDESLTIPYDNNYIYDDMMLYAKFELKTYTITLVNGFNTVNEYQVTALTIPPILDDISQYGYDFDGWYLDEGKTVSYSTLQAVIGDTIIYAKFSPILLTVTFIVDGEKYMEVDVAYGSLFVDITPDAFLIESVSYLEGLANMEIDGTILQGNAVITLGAVSELDQAMNFITENWIIGVVGIVGVVLLFSIITLLVPKRRKR